MTDAPFQMGDRVKIKKPKSAFDGLEGIFLRYEGSNLCRIRLDELAKGNNLFDCGLSFFVREIEPLG